MTGEKMKNVEALIEKSVEYLETMQRAEESKNRPLYPTMIVFLGEEAAKRYETLAHEMNRNWGAYCRYLPFLQVFCTEEGEVRVKDLRKKESQESAAIDDEECNLLDEAFGAMLGLKTQIFPVRSHAKIECIMSSAEKDWEILYEAIAGIGRNYHFTALRTLYLCIDQSKLAGKKQAKKVIQGLHRLEKARREAGGSFLQAVYLLSNYLQDRLLAGKDLRENDRLIADLILLGGNISGEEKIRMDWLYDTDGSIFKSASFSKVEKPVQEIAITTLYHVIDALKKKILEEDSCAEMTRLLEKLGLTKNEIPEIEKAFGREILPKLPDAKLLEYLPRGAGYDEAAKQKNSSLEGYYRATCQSGRLVYETYFYGRTKAWLEEKGAQLSQEIADAWAAKATYHDMELYFGKEAFHETIKVTVALNHGGGRTLEDRMKSKMQEQCKACFYEEVVKRCVRGLETWAADAEAFHVMLDGVCRELEENNMIGADLKANIDAYYGGLIARAAQSVAKEKTAALFGAKQDQEAFLDHVYQMFVSIVNSDSLKQKYCCSFEDELNNRLERISMAERMIYVNNELEGDSLQKYSRIHLLGNGASAYTVYLINEDANYAKQLTCDDAVKKIDLDKKECFEKLMVYNVAAEQIDYMVEDGQ